MFFQNSNSIRLYQKTAFGINFIPWEVPKIDVDDDDDDDDDDFDDDSGDYDVIFFIPKDLKHDWHQGGPISYYDDDDIYDDHDEDDKNYDDDDAIFIQVQPSIATFV